MASEPRPSSDRRATLAAARGFLALEPRAPELQLLHRWADCWRGLGDVVTGMSRQGYQVSLSDHPRLLWAWVPILGGPGSQGLR